MDTQVDGPMHRLTAVNAKAELSMVRISCALSSATFCYSANEYDVTKIQLERIVKFVIPVLKLTNWMIINQEYDFFIRKLSWLKSQNFQ